MKIFFEKSLWQTQWLLNNFYSCENNIDDCEAFNQPCKNNGKCMDGNNTYSCQCISSWKGENCTTEQDPCTLFSPCANTATCKRDPNEGIN